MTNERYEAELSVLTSKLTQNLFRFLDMGTHSPHLVLAARTNRGNIYTLYVDLRGFPDSSPPKVFVTRMLRTRSGSDMDGCSAQMHTLTSEHGWTRICHYGGESWKEWNAAMREKLINAQIQTGTEAGAWDFSNEKLSPNSVFPSSPFIDTALSALTLETYYRYKPFYLKREYGKGFPIE